jgi:hypothetical protein
MIVYHYLSCSATNKWKAQLCVASMFASTWGSAHNIVKAGGQLKKAQDWWEKEKIDQDFRQTVTDICKFVTESAHEGRPPFFHTESNLALNEKYKNIRN